MSNCRGGLTKGEGGRSNTKDKIGIVEEWNQEVSNLNMMVGSNYVIVAHDINTFGWEGEFVEKGLIWVQCRSWAGQSMRTWAEFSSLRQLGKGHLLFMFGSILIMCLLSPLCPFRRRWSIWVVILSGCFFQWSKPCLGRMRKFGKFMARWRSSRVSFSQVARNMATFSWEWSNYQFYRNVVIDNWTELIIDQGCLRGLGPVFK